MSCHVRPSCPRCAFPSTGSVSADSEAVNPLSRLYALESNQASICPSTHPPTFRSSHPPADPAIELINCSLRICSVLGARDGCTQDKGFAFRKLTRQRVPTGHSHRRKSMTNVLMSDDSSGENRLS